MSPFRLVTLFLLPSLSFGAFLSTCSFDDRISLVRCQAKQFRAGLAIDVFRKEQTDQSLTRMNQRCEEFLDCFDSVNRCPFFGSNLVKKQCEELMSKALFMKCSSFLISGSKPDKEPLQTSFKQCIDDGKEQNKSECDILVECTEKMINDTCHKSVLPEVINKFGNIFYDVSECQDKPAT